MPDRIYDCGVVAVDQQRGAIGICVLRVAAKMAFAHCLQRIVAQIGARIGLLVGGRNKNVVDIKQ